MKKINIVGIVTGVIVAGCLHGGLLPVQHTYAKSGKQEHMVTAFSVTGSAVTTDAAVQDGATVSQTPVPVTEMQLITETPTQNSVMQDMAMQGVLEETMVNPLEQVTKGIALTQKNMKIGIQEKVKIRLLHVNGRKVSYQSSKKKIAMVTSKGIVKGKKQGRTTIRISSEDKYLQMNLQVKKKPVSIWIKKPKITSVSKGTKIPLKVTCNKGSASYAIKWKSSKKSVASVDSKGVMKIKGRGRTLITAKTYNGVVAKMIFSLN